MEEYSIMPSNEPKWSNKRFSGSERHEIFEGRTGNRNKSVEDGLVIFTTPDLHRTGKNSIHMAPREWLYLKELGEKTWCEFYNKNPREFLERYGRNYL